MLTLFHDHVWLVGLLMLAIHAGAAAGASPHLDLVYIAEAAGENNMGIVATGLFAANEINTNSAEAKAILPAGCTPTVSIKLHDHGVNVNQAAKIPIVAANTIDGIIGPDYSSISVVVSPVAAVFNTPVLSYWATSPALNGDAYGNFQRTIPDDLAAALAVLEYLKAKGIKYANVGYSPDPYGLGFTEAVVADAKKYGIKVNTASGDESDIGALGKAIEKSDVNVWILVMAGGDIKKWLSAILKETSRDIHFIFSETMSNNILCTAENRVENCVSVEEQPKLEGSVVIKAQGFNPANALGEALKEKMKTTGVPMSDIIAADPNNVFQYRTDADTAASPNLKYPGGVHDVGAFSYDAVYAYARAACLESRPACCKIKDTPCDDAKCALYILKNTAVPFQGASGLVKFKPESGYTRDPATAYMTLTQAKATTVSANVGAVNYELASDFSGGAWANLPCISGGKAKCRSDDDTDFTPLKPVTVDEVRVSPGLKVAMAIIAGVSIFFAVVFCIWTMVNSKVSVVKRAQPAFLYMMCFGCILSSAVPIVLSLDGASTCKASWMIYAAGFSITMGALAAKTIRVYRIFMNKALKKMVLTVQNSLPPALLIIAIDIGLGLGMILSDSVEWKEISKATDEFDRSTKMQYECRSKGPWVTAFFVCNLVVLLILVILCYKSRKINQAFSESKYISMAVVSSFQLILIGFILIILIDSNPTVNYLLVSAMTLLTDGSTLFLIFGPKLYSHMTGEKAGASTTGTSGTTGTAATGSATVSTVKTAPEQTA